MYTQFLPEVQIRVPSQPQSCTGQETYDLYVTRSFRSEASHGSFVGVSHTPVQNTDSTIQETRSITDPAPHELQIAVKATGICGSDFAYYSKFRNGDLQAVAPLSLGHESAGIVVALGQGVTSFQIGDRVALEVGVPCDSCRSCQRGRYNLCPKMRFRSSAKSVPHYQGTLQERINHPAKWCYK